MRQPDNKQHLLRYLMGEMGDEEQGRLEVSYLVDDHLFEEILLAEDELIESYARNEFSEHERKRIEKFFLRSPARRQKVRFIRVLMNYSARQHMCSQPASAKLKRASWRNLISFFGIRV